jgi:hypothetical protein
LVDRRSFRNAVIGDLRYTLAKKMVDAAMLHLHLLLKAGFRPDQPRVPTGNPDGGQWTDETLSPTLVQSRGSGRSSGRRASVTNLSQETRLEISQMQMRSAVREAQSIDRNWRPRPQAYETVEGQIRANEATRLEAELRYFQLTGRPPRVGPFAREWLPSPAPGKRISAEQRKQLDLIGRMYGCHSCGSVDNLSPRGHPFGDHQIPQSLGRPTRIYPHCTLCSSKQGQVLQYFLRHRYD